MSKPALELADILRVQGSRFFEHYQSSISYQQLKVFRAVLACRTASLGGHLDVCSQCGFETGISFNSCLMGSVYLWGVRAMNSVHSEVWETLLLPIRNRVLRLE